MNSWKNHLSTRLLCGVVSLCLVFGAPAPKMQAQTTFPQYDHVFLLVMESEPKAAILGNADAPILNALANDYGLATNYSGVGDPSEPNYVAMLGGDTFGLTTDDPYWFPGQTINASNLMTQLEAAGKTWRGYFQNMPYPGYRGYCYPDKCLGIPDADTQYVAKHNGIVNFANMQNPTEFGKMFPFSQLAEDLEAGTVSNFSYIVPDECDDMHGAPPWCVDSGATSSVQQSFLIARGDAFVGSLVNAITSSSMWLAGNNAIVITFDEGNTPTGLVATIVITSHGPRGVKDKTSLTHFSLLASLQQTFGLPCLANACTANLMTALFTITGSMTVPTLPAPFDFPTSNDMISKQGTVKNGPAVSLTGLTGWTQVTTPNFGTNDNVLAGVSAASTTDVWAVGAFIPTANGVLNALAQHFDGIRWVAIPLPNVGDQQNILQAVSMPGPGKAWAVGDFINGKFHQHTLIEHFDGAEWSVVSSPNPGDQQNILYGVAAISDTDVWAVGAFQDANDLWHTLAEHWDGSKWSVVDTVDPGTHGNQLFAVKALASNNVYAIGQRANAGFPNQALIEHWDGTAWSVVTAPAHTSASALPLGLTAASSLTIVGQQETDTAPYTSYVAVGSPATLAIQPTPTMGTGENDLFAVTIANDGSTWAVGWAINPATDLHDPLVMQGVNGTFSLVSVPNPFSGGDSGFAAITTIPGGGMWAVGGATSPTSNVRSFIEFHP
ncbi:MAG TPA: alkaline phosphatase family protein [Candidatus Angelobacter sp.]